MPSLLFQSIRWWDSPYINHFISADTVVQSYANPQSLNRYSYVSNNPLRYTDPTGHMMIQGCGEDGKGNCDVDPKEEARNLQHIKKLSHDVYKRQCAAGNAAYCDGDPKKVAAFALTMWTGGALAESAILGGGAADLAGAVPGLINKAGQGIITACLMNSLCQQLLPKAYDPRVEAQSDAFHAFPRLLDPIIMKSGDKAINGPFINYTVEGSVEVAGKVTSGVFEIGVRVIEWVPTIVHHFFNPSS